MKKYVVIVLLILLSFCPCKLVKASNQTYITTTGGTSNSGIYYKDYYGNQVSVYSASYKIGDSDAYCIHPGRAAPGGTIYYEDETLDISNCGENFTYACGLAYIVAESRSNNYSYRATETALRLFSAYSVDASSEMSGSDGWYDSGTGITVRASIYQNTARAVMNWGYNVDNRKYCTDSFGNQTECVNVLYADGEEGENLKAGIELFKKAMSTEAKEQWTPQVEMGDTVRGENGDVTFTINTNFNSSTDVNIPESISGYPVTATIENCETGCEVKLTVNVPDANECVNMDFDLSFEDARYSLGALQQYKPGGASNQYFISYDSEPIGNTFPIDYEWCGEDDDDDDDDSPENSCCSNMTIQDNLPLSCEASNEGTIEDPEICTIANACDKNKQSAYDYTKKAGLNEDYCKLYCREEIEFTFMDKTEVIAGRQFKYDVASRISTMHKLSTVIYGTRQCTAPEIKYDEWEKDYLEADKAIVSAWNNLKKWETLYNHISEYKEKTLTENCSDVSCCSGCCSSCESDGSNSSCCGNDYSDVSCTKDYTVWYWGTNGSGPFPYNETDVDANSNSVNAVHSSGSATCEANACSSICNITITKPTNEVIKSSYNAAINAYKAALEKREKLLMDIQNCNLLKYSDFTYKPEEYYVSVTESPYTYSFGEGNTAYFKLVNEYDFYSVIDIDYEDDYSPMIQITSDEPVQHEITQGWCKDCELKSICPTCMSEPQINSSLSKKEDLRRLKCYGSETGAYCEIKLTVVPNNKAANLTTSKEQHFWQSALFYTQLYTGIVSPVPDGQGYWIGLDSYIYPVTLNKQNGDYYVHVDISNIGAATRPENIKISDKEFICSFEVINETTMFECDPSIENCEIECDPRVENCDDMGGPDDKKVSLGMIVRSVDLTNLFPTNRVKGMNWQNATNVISAIQNLGDSVWTSKQPQYVIELSPMNIRNIKNYNNYTDYMDYSLSCDSSLNCTSNFLTTISRGSDYAYNVDLSLGRNKTTDDYNNYYKYGR